MMTAEYQHEMSKMPKLSFKSRISKVVSNNLPRSSFCYVPCALDNSSKVTKALVKGALSPGLDIDDQSCDLQYRTNPLGQELCV